MPQFNPKRVLRQISNPLLKEFLERQGHRLPVAWDQITDAQMDGVSRALQGLSDHHREIIEIVLQDVDDLAMEDGIRVLVEEGRNRGIDLHADLEAMVSQFDKAMWVLLHHPDIWSAAVMFARSDNLPARSWTKRPDMPMVDPGTSQEDITRFEGALSLYYQDQQYRGHRTKIEHFIRGEQDYYFVYLSDYAETHINFDDEGEFHRSPDRRAFEIVFAHDRHAGTLDLFAKGGKKVVEALQQIFSRMILGEDLLPADPNSHPYALDHLMIRRSGFPTDPEDGITQVSIESLRLSVVGRRRRRHTVEIDPGAGPEAIYDAMDSDLNKERLLRSILHVTKARFRLQFNGNGQALTFDVSFPSSCNLKSKRDAHRVIGEKYLKRWAIDVS